MVINRAKKCQQFTREAWQTSRAHWGTGEDVKAEANIFEWPWSRENEEPNLWCGLIFKNVLTRSDYRDLIQQGVSPAHSPVTFQPLIINVDSGGGLDSYFKD